MKYSSNEKTIVVSAVNLIEAGTLAILRECLGYLSELADGGNYRVIAVVYSKDLVNFPNIEYIETQWPKKRWINRLCFEYVSMKEISKEIGHVSLWLSLHDTTPNVVAERRAVYCHNPFPFYKWKWRESLFAPKIVLFALFSKFIYRKNIHKNNFVIVQQQWLKDEFIKLFGLSKEELIVALPDAPKNEEFVGFELDKDPSLYSFIFAGSPNSHKNFEIICKASNILQNELGSGKFSVYITVKGTENKYAEYLYNNWSKVDSLKFIGFQDRKSMFDYYNSSNCLIFPSKVETWGLPITEFSAFNKPMLLADLPYAHETAAGSKFVSFFDADSPEALAIQMKQLISGDESFLKPVESKPIEEPTARSWKELFEILLEDRKKENLITNS
ncbi:glycosyltransferase [Sphingobacterium hungaricum]|uniref:Glycosyltransferase n=1 Tax=Sphingobacterium hungaricum TaxID=2082723 RepID=A0A928US84_9SPHI|nr:glycosyltransferase [Sphingobacterium hungaricum]MBE8712351.1 glycosyltransferase [Sphingobacterium hungaricum]